MFRNRYLFVGLLLLLILIMPYVRVTLEASMIGTMLVQIPLLICSGYLLAKGFPRKWHALFGYLNENGIPGIVVTLSVIAYWFLPRSIDGALNEILMEISKYMTLPFVAGILMYYSWKLLGPISKAFIWANGISMIFVMSWLYTVSPVRLCNNYLVTSQQQLGKAMFIVGLGICVLFIGRAFIGKPLVTRNKKTDKFLIVNEEMVYQKLIKR